MNVNKIFVLGDGALLEEGTHDNLLADPNSAYSEMWSNYLQKKQKELIDNAEEVKVEA
jgi:ABC-type multidrug transport system fused ATPase/permease subunit